MASYLDRNKALLDQKVYAWPIGAEMGLKEAFGSGWAKVGGEGERKAFGREFRAAVKSGKLYPQIEWVRIENSGRFDVYKKV